MFDEKTSDAGQDGREGNFSVRNSESYKNLKNRPFGKYNQEDDRQAHQTNHSDDPEIWEENR